MRSPKPGEYRPSRWLKGACVAALLLFGGFLVRELLDAEPRPWLAAALGLCTLVGIAGVVETLVARVRIEETGVAVRGLLGTRFFPFERIESVKLDGGLTNLKMKSGEWRRLPDWLGANMSARHRIAARIAARRGGDRDA